MKKLTMILSLVVTGILFAGGVALAANVQCEEPDPDSEAMFSCLGTSEADRIVGTDGDDSINAKQKDDVVTAGIGSDQIRGGVGADRLFGNVGGDFVFPSAIKTEGETTRYVDDSDDFVRGGQGGDVLYGGLGQGGRDQVRGDSGDDFILVTQRLFRAQGIEVKITKETVDCGSGADTVYYDDGVDVIDEENCETLIPFAPNGEPVPTANGQSRSAASIPSLDSLLK